MEVTHFIKIIKFIDMLNIKVKFNMKIICLQLSIFCRCAPPFPKSWLCQWMAMTMKLWIVTKHTLLFLL